MTALARTLAICAAIMLMLPGMVSAETYSYDETGRLTGVTYGDGTAISYTYDNNGNILDKTVTKPVVLPTLTVSLNGSAFITGQTLNLTGTVVQGTPVNVDVWITLKLPNGKRYYLKANGTISKTAVPVMSNWPAANFNSTVFTHTFAGTEPVGSFVWEAVLTQPGTMNYLGPASTAPFTFTP